MIIPIRCFSCNNIIASKYETYKVLSQKNNESSEDLIDVLNDQDQFKIIIENSKELFDKLGIKRYCCKRHLLTHVDLIEKI